MSTDPLIINGWIQVSEGQYYLMAAGASQPEPPTQAGRILSNEADEGSLYIKAGTYEGKIHLAVHVHAEAPPPDDTSWEVVEDSEIEASEGELDVIKWGGGVPGDFSDLAYYGPGTYHVRVHTRRRPLQATDLTDSEDVDPATDIEKGLLEEHLIVMWPEPQ
ncbi:hypothetical protein ACSNOI_46970 [Actinomadura kijaniata]|uniref:hypothetical protein n=1 Tax=Actinomadura kijaniata TaxID=46161 RepID=UPI003F1A60B9